MVADETLTVFQDQAARNEAHGTIFQQTHFQTTAHHITQLELACGLKPEHFSCYSLTLEPGTEVIYKVTQPYAPANDHGFLWSDPDVAIDWGFDPEALILSDKDRVLPRLAEIDSPFVWEGAA